MPTVLVAGGAGFIQHQPHNLALEKNTDFIDG